MSKDILILVFNDIAKYCNLAVDELASQDCNDSFVDYLSDLVIDLSRHLVD